MDKTREIVVKDSASHEIRTELKKLTLSAVKVRSSRENITGPYEKVLVTLRRRRKESHVDLACVSFFIRLINFVYVQTL